MTREKILFLLIAGLGLFLRLWLLGKQPFWLDELGVAEVAFQPTIIEMLKSANNHVMAMPLDYVIAWLMAHISHKEGFLRLPEAVWGFLTLIAGYKLCFNLFENRRTSLFAMHMIALSPFLIQYSQELRFYAPLTFFYILSLSLGLTAMQGVQKRDWVVFTLTALTGLYFHFFTILIFVPMFLWIVTNLKKERWAEQWNYFLTSASVLGVALMAGIVVFGTPPSQSITLFQYESFSYYLLAGLGWIPNFQTSPAGWIFGGLLCVFSVFGIFITLRKNPLSLPSLLLYGLGIQVIAIVIFDLLAHYFVSARQIIMLAPVMMIFSAYGVNQFIEQIATKNITTIQFRKHSNWTSFGLGLAILITAIPILTEYYQMNKTASRSILIFLSEEWQSGEAIYVDPGTMNLYIYYGGQNQETQALTSAIQPLESTSENSYLLPGPAWAITSLKETEKALKSAGFSPAFLPPENTFYPEVLWRRK